MGKQKNPEQQPADESPITIRFILEPRKGEELPRVIDIVFPNRYDFMRQMEFTESKAIAHFQSVDGMRGVNMAKLDFYKEVKFNKDDPPQDGV